MAFVLQDVIEELERSRSLEPLKKLKKENLVKVTAHYGISPAAGAKRSNILDLIVHYCIKNDIIDEVEENPTAETAEVLRLKLEFEHEEQRLSLEAAHELRLAELKEAHKLRELELKAEAKKEAAASEYELKMAGLGMHPPKDVYL